MKRIHLFEFGDQAWFPFFLRNYMTDFLQYLSNAAQVYAPVVDEIETTLRENKLTRIVDLGSGGGGGWLWLSAELKKRIPDLTIKLTDLYPNAVAFQEVAKRSVVFQFTEQPVDAREVPEDLKGLRTQLLSFHHFKPEEAIRILQNAVDSRQPLAVLEIQDRSVISILTMLLSPVSVLLFTPFIRPFRFYRLLFTYLIPVVPLVVLWDGIVSCLRTYTVEELKSLVQQVDQHTSFDWKIEKKQAKKGFVIYLIGQPVERP